MTIGKQENIREILVYGAAGATTTLLNIFIYQASIYCGIEYQIANLWAVIISKVYAYVANKYFVFHSRCATWRGAFVEFGKYAVARGMTGLIDYFGLILAIEVFEIDMVYAKYLIVGIVIVANYFAGKYFVFDRHKEAV